MRNFARLLIALSFLIIIHKSSFIIRNALAQGEFQTDYKVNYVVNEQGKTNVTQNIVLKNKTANFYADKFELKIGSTKVEDVKANDALGAMETTVSFENNVTTISVKFNQRVIGVDKTLPWTLNYTSNELATKSGQIWEVSIPKVAESQDISSYSATVNTPQSFGPVAFAVPTPLNAQPQLRGQTYTFDKEQLTKSGIAMSFGEKQVFSFNLNYYLENQNLTAQSREIALPPDNNYQKIVIETIEPKPQDVTVDVDGNFLAKYKLSPKQKLDIKVSGSVEVFSKPFRNIQPKLSEAERDRYTLPQRYWESDNPWVRDKANELKTAQKIYEFVSSYLSYSQERLNSEKIERKGAAKAALTPKDSICMEFTDLFIALARSAGIPAREVEGYAYTQNERLRPLSLNLQNNDVLHAWPEYWDDNLGWVQVDPTWGSTSGGLDYFNKLDFNHITFIRRGASSTTPYPPGAYKREKEPPQKEVFVNFAQDLPQATIAPELELSVPDEIISGVPVKVTAWAKNVGSASIIDGTLTLTTSLRTSGENPARLGILPPYATRQVDYKLQTGGFFTTATEPISLSLGDKFISKSVRTIPVYFLLVSANFIIGVVLAVFIIIAGFYLYKRFHIKKAPKQQI